MFDGFFDQYSIENGYQDPAFDEEDEGALSPKQQRQRRARMIQNPDAAVMPPSLAMGSPPLGLPPMPSNTTPGIVAGAGQPPVIGTPKGPAVMTSPTSAAILPDLIPRREGVTLNDKMRGIYATMGAMGTPTFNSQYAAIQDRLLQKDLDDDAFNQKMDLLTLPSYEIDKATGNMVTKPAQYVKTQDGWKLNSDTKPTFEEGYSASGLSGLTPEQRALVKNATGDNGDTMPAFFLGKNADIIPEHWTFEDFVSSTLNANQGETSKSFNRNTSIFSDNGFTDGQSRSLAMLAENGGLEIIKNPDTGEIKAFDPVTRETFVIEDYETGLQKIVGAASRKQDATNRSDLDREQVTTITTRLNELDQNLGQIRKSDEVSQYWIDQLEAKDEAGQYVIDYGKDFGWLNSLMSDYFGIASPEFSGLSSDSIYEALQNLDITNLAPVSNFEFKQVMKLFANGSLGTREQALAVLKRAQSRADREQGESQRKYDNDLDGLKELQGETGPEYLNYRGRKSWITDDEARSRYGGTAR